MSKPTIFGFSVEEIDGVEPLIGHRKMEFLPLDAAMVTLPPGMTARKFINCWHCGTGKHWWSKRENGYICPNCHKDPERREVAKDDS